ncbi:MAG: 3-methyl-2-oxobutanoate hydroxymethyltransferase [Thermodesulfobacteriota bacterium]
MKKITVPEIIAMKASGEKIPVLTAYDFTMASILSRAGVPVLMVGDSAGMVAAGLETTLPVKMGEMLYHTRSVARGAGPALTVADMPFGSYQGGAGQGLKNAVRLIQAGAGAVKLEGGVRTAHIIKAITDMDIPVMGHIGLTPQSVHKFGGFKVQGRDDEAKQAILADAEAVAGAGAFAIVIEAVPAELAAKITASLSIPTIGIGAGPDCDGQVLVINDMLGLTAGDKVPKFVKKYQDMRSLVTEAALSFMEEVRGGVFPDEEYTYK